MEIQLATDFMDYYDHWFDRDGPVFKRFSRSGMNREEMLQYMNSVGIPVPEFGTVCELKGNGDSEVVVYIQKHLHRGEGKVKLSLTEARQKYLYKLATRYIPNFPGVSRRYLQIGNHFFWLEYRSNDWRSNYGSEVDIKLISAHKGYHEKIHLPLFAIDYVIADKLLAVDFNIAPGVKGTGVEKLLPAKEAVEAIKKAIEDNYIQRQ